MNATPCISVIISTYNASRWLELSLEGFFGQHFSGPYEIIIADDGSTEETLQMVERIAVRSSVPIVYVWQPDEGFQKCRILNKAIALAQGSILVFTDGDCIPQFNMLQVHAKMSKRRSFLTGGYLKLPEFLSSQISADAIKDGRIFRASWLVSNGYTPSAKLLKLMMPKPLDRLANSLTTTRRTWNGHNSSCFREDAIAVNGFNEMIQYGGEDVEFGCRLNHAGIYGRHLRFSTIPLHLYHRHGYVTPGMLERSRALRERTNQSRIIRTTLGVDQWLCDGGEVRLSDLDMSIKLGPST